MLFYCLPFSDQENILTQAYVCDDDDLTECPPENLDSVERGGILVYKCPPGARGEILKLENKREGNIIAREVEIYGNVLNW